MSNRSYFEVMRDNDYIKFIRCDNCDFLIYSYESCKCPQCHRRICKDPKYYCTILTKCCKINMCTICGSHDIINCKIDQILQKVTSLTENTNILVRKMVPVTNVELDHLHNPTINEEDLDCGDNTEVNHVTESNCLDKLNKV